MNGRVAHTRVNAMWDERCAPWLQVGDSPGSVRTKAPPRVRRPLGGSGSSLLLLPLQAWMVAAVARLR